MSQALETAAVFAFGFAYAQRTLSTKSRFLRLRVAGFVANDEDNQSGMVHALNKEWLLNSYETALGVSSFSMMALASAMIISR